LDGFVYRFLQRQANFVRSNHWRDIRDWLRDRSALILVIEDNPAFHSTY
jgi:hypothetical protein